MFSMGQRHMIEYLLHPLQWTSHSDENPGRATKESLYVGPDILPHFHKGWRHLPHWKILLGEWTRNFWDHNSRHETHAQQKHFKDTCQCNKIGKIHDLDAELQNHVDQLVGALFAKKITSFAWQVMNRAIATNGWHFQKIIGPNDRKKCERCSICDTEDIYHCMWECHKAVVIWEWIVFLASLGSQSPQQHFDPTIT